MNEKKKLSGNRDEIPEEFKWNLSDLFSSNEDWQEEKKRLEFGIDQISKFKNILSTSAEKLLACLDMFFSFRKDINRLAVYAYQLADSDAKKTLPQTMRQEVDKLSNDFESHSSFILPEIMALSKVELDKYLKGSQALQLYTQYLNDIRRFKKHTRNSAEEEIISQTGLVNNFPSEINEIFRDVNMLRPIIEIDAKKTYLSDANFSLYRSNPDQKIRRLVFEELFKTYKKQENFYGLQFSGYLRNNLFYKKVRNYSSCLEKSLHANNIPVEVYYKLISSTHKNLDKLHRYLKLRQRILKLDKLNYYDLHTPLVKELNTNYSLTQAQELIEQSLQVLGDDYLKNIKMAFSDRWIDFYYNDNKRSGAYSNGSAYDVHPYILMNYMGKYNDVATLTHELGHSMHSYYSNKNQAYVNSDYPIFLAEVASISNEALLSNSILQNTKDRQERLALLGGELEHYRTTLFRQTKFAEFELKVHELAESGKSLSGEDLSEIYLRLLKKYYGHDEGIVNIDNLYGVEWAYIPHFYYNFYVFQYATSLCASNMITEKLIAQEQGIKEKYLNDFLSAGCSNYPIEILKKLGVDMSSDEPYDLAFSKMDEIMNEIEEIIN